MRIGIIRTNYYNSGLVGLVPRMLVLSSYGPACLVGNFQTIQRLLRQGIQMTGGLLRKQLGLRSLVLRVRGEDVFDDGATRIAASTISECSEAKTDVRVC